MKNKIRVLLCGTVFGQIYLRGVLLNENFQLSGILSQGSEQSREIAKACQQPVYTDINKISSDEFDLAFVVIRSGIVGGEGSQVAQILLHKNISVIQEQPVHKEEAIENYKIAIKHNVFYKVHTFYAYLPVSRIFYEKTCELKEKSKIYSIDGACSLPVLLPFIDQIGRILGGIHPYCLDYEHCFQTDIQNYICGTIKGVPFMFRIQSHMNAEHLKKYAYLLNEINVMTGMGNLKLTEVNGQVVWVSKPYIAEEYLKQKEIDEFRNVNGSELLYDAGGKRYSELYESVWPEAVNNFLIENEERIRTKKCDAADMQYYAALCCLWKDLSNQISR